MQTQEYVKYAMVNIQRGKQQFMDMLKRKRKVIIKKNDSADTPNGPWY